MLQSPQLRLQIHMQHQRQWDRTRTRLPDTSSPNSQLGDSPHLHKILAQGIRRATIMVPHLRHQGPSMPHRLSLHHQRQQTCRTGTTLQW
jgi:hypothetical protein